MANKFNVRKRSRFFGGVEIFATPIPWGIARQGVGISENSQAAVEFETKVINTCCTYSDGTPVNADDIPVDLIGSIFKWLGDSSEGARENFTSPPSTATPPPPAETPPSSIGLPAKR